MTIEKVSSMIYRAEKMLEIVRLMADPIWNQALITIQRQKLELSDKEFEALAKAAAGEISIEEILPAGLKTVEQRSIARRSLFKRTSPNFKISNWEKKYSNMAINAAMFK